MENSLNISAIELYSRKALRIFLEEHFTQEKITGQEILHFSAIEQVNFFVVQQLFSKWQEETLRLRSPYFNFEAEEVKNALSAFANELSKHILVAKEDFTPLLLQAIHFTLFFSLSPVKFLEQKYLDANKTYSQEELKSLFKYLKIHTPLVDFLKTNTDKFSGQSGKAILDQITTSFERDYQKEEVSQLVLSQFNELLAVVRSDFYYSEASPIVDTLPKEKHEETKQVTLNDLLAKDQKSTVLNLHTKNKIMDIRSAMSINQKFMFIKDLFKNDNTAFDGAMSMADGCESYEKAVNSLIDNYSQRYNWEIDSPQVNELFDLIGRKFYPEAFERSE